jgi:hypothetical protein
MATVFPIFLALAITPDTTVLFATMMFCSLATVTFGLWPALRLSRPDLQSALKDHAGEMSGTIAGRITVRDGLVAAQLALSLALLVLSGLFVRGAAAGASANPGFGVGQLAIAQIEPKSTQMSGVLRNSSTRCRARRTTALVTTRAARNAPG